MNLRIKRGYQHPLDLKEAIKMLSIWEDHIDMYDEDKFYRLNDEQIEFCKEFGVDDKETIEFLSGDMQNDQEVNKTSDRLAEIVRKANPEFTELDALRYVYDKRRR